MTAVYTLGSTPEIPLFWNGQSYSLLLPSSQDELLKGGAVTGTRRDIASVCWVGEHDQDVARLADLAGRRAVWSNVSDGVMSAGARSPEELEVLFEDALVIRDGKALTELFEDGALLVAGDARLARGGEEIAQFALATWGDDHTYIADPQRVMQARDIALVIVEGGINVARRSHGGAWRYAIVFLSVDDETERSEQ